MAFGRDRNSRPDGDRGGFRPRPSFGGGRPSFGGRSDRGPVEMHKAICDNCGKECTVPFRPTQGKPVYCSDCFEQKGGNDSRGFERRDTGRSEERPSFNRERAPEQPRVDRLEEVNAKLDRILEILSAAIKEDEEEIEEEVNEAPAEVVVEKAVKVSKRKAKIEEVIETPSIEE